MPSFRLEVSAALATTCNTHQKLTCSLVSPVGILGIPGTFGVLGFAPGLISLLLLSSISTLSAWYIAKVRIRHPQIANIGDFGYTIGGKVGSAILAGSYWCVYSFFLYYMLPQPI